MTSWVYTFEEATGMSPNELGGKGYSLVEMTSIGLPVPPGLVIVTKACREYFSKGNKIVDEVMKELFEKIKYIEEKTGRKFGSSRKPLLLSVRSGAPVSMPGMLDTILNLGMNDAVAESLAKESGDPRFAYDAYRRFIQMFSKIVLKVKGEEFDRMIEQKKKELGVKDDPSIPADAWKDLIDKFKLLTKKEAGKEIPQDPYEQLKLAVIAVFDSWNNPRAVQYRKFYKIPDYMGTAVNIQAMVFGNLGYDSGTGVAFTRDPSTGEKRIYGEYLLNAQGEDIVAGIRTPKPIEEMREELPHIYDELIGVATKLEHHFKDLQDFEFTIQSGKLYMLQTRSGKRTAQAAVKVAVDMVNEGLISKEEAILRVNPSDLSQLLHRRIDPKVEVKPIAKGLNASPGAASGKVVFEADEAAELGSKGEKVILVRPETTPEDIHGVIASQGVLTSRGGMTSHAAVVARGMGKPAVVGCEEIRIDLEAGYFEAKGVKVMKGEVITIDGTTGSVILGEVPTIEPELSKELKQLLSWADNVRRLGIRANADTPEAASKAREFGAEGIGLCRTERMFNAQDRLPIVQQMIMSGTQEDRMNALNKLLPMQKEDFKKIFATMRGLPVTVRLLDLPLHEFLPRFEELVDDISSLKIKGVSEELVEKERILSRVRQLAEHNPMLGHRGCRLAITYPEIYEMQTRAIIEAAIEVLEEKGETVKVQIMLPLVSEANEIAYLKDVVKNVAEEVFRKKGVRIDYKVGTMIETPRAALTARDIAKFAEFFSFGTNDLTQTTFGFSRDDVEAKFMAYYLEKKILPENPFEVLDSAGVGRLVELATKEGRSARHDIEIGICGEHGGEPNSIAFFEKVGLDYVSCSPYRVPVARLAAAQATLNLRG